MGLWRFRGLLILAILALPGVVLAESNFQRIQVTETVSIELPKNWSILSSNTRATIDSSAEAQQRNRPPTNLPFAANLYNDNSKTIAQLNFRFYPENEFTQQDCRRLADADLSILDSAGRSATEGALNKSGARNITFEKSRKSNINSVCVIRQGESYDMPAERGRFKSIRIRVWQSPNSFTLSLGYYTSLEGLMAPIVQRILESLQVK